MSRIPALFGVWRSQIFSLLCIAIITAWPAYPLQAEASLLNRKLVFDVVDMEKRSGDEFKLSPEVGNVVGSRIHLYNSVHEGRPVYVMEKEDRMRDGDLILWTFFLDKTNLGLIRLEKIMKSRSGRIVSETWYDYEDVMFSFPKNLCYMYTIPTWLMGKKIELGSRYDFNLLLSYNGAPMHMYADVKSEVTITVPAGKYECFLIKLEPDLKQILGKWNWAAKIIRPFVPDYYFWVKKEYPHSMVRFEGKFGPVGGSPTQAYVLLSESTPEGE